MIRPCELYRRVMDGREEEEGHGVKYARSRN